jgi:hypothetical protein
VDPVPDPIFLRKSGRPGIEPGTSGQQSLSKILIIIKVRTSIEYSSPHIERIYTRINYNFVRRNNFQPTW